MRARGSIKKQKGNTPEKIQEHCLFILKENRLMQP